MVDHNAPFTLKSYIPFIRQLQHISLHVHLYSNLKTHANMQNMTPIGTSITLNFGLNLRYDARTHYTNYRHNALILTI